MKIVYTFKAQQDLQDIYKYIAYTLLVPDTARKMIQFSLPESCMGAGISAISLKRQLNGSELFIQPHPPVRPASSISRFCTSKGSR